MSETRSRAHVLSVASAVMILAFGSSHAALDAQESADLVTAIVGATLIDGTGGSPLRDTTVVIKGSRIVAVGPRASVNVPSAARLVDGAGKYLTPGFIDT